MLTPRGFRLLLALAVLFGLGVFTGVPTLILVALTLLSWFFGSWLLFVVRARLLDRRLRVEREVADERGPVISLWAGRTFRVRVIVRAGTAPAYRWVSDRVPYRAQFVDGLTHTETVAPGTVSTKLEYTIRCPHAGAVRLEGVTVEVSDLQGFFYERRFVQDVQVYRVLPALADARGHVPTVKRHNLLPLLGSHRHPRPGTGSELLDLRDYIPGDPPRTIAWKVSARRDRLMTKEFESEVPVRCTFFVDTSQSVRVGTAGQNALARLVEITASTAQATAGARDLTGLCMFDEHSSSYIRPARTSGHLVRLLTLLAEVADLAPCSRDGALDELLPLAYAMAHEVYPQLLRKEVNHFPRWLPWLAPRPAWTMRLPRLRARSLLSWPLVWLRRALRTMGLFLRQEVGSRLSPRARRHYRWRKQMAAVLSVQHGLAPGGLALLLEDDEACVLHLQRFLAEHHVPYRLPYYGRQGQYLFAGIEKVDVLAQALLRAVGRAHDNELFLLLVDLLEVDAGLKPLLSAVQVALARHHQVMVLCPWPPGLPMPPQNPLVAEPVPDRRLLLEEVVEQAVMLRFHRAYHQLRRTFGKLRVVVLCASSDESVPLILARMERLRRQERGVR